MSVMEISVRLWHFMCQLSRSCSSRLRIASILLSSGGHTFRVPHINRSYFIFSWRQRLSRCTLLTVSHFGFALIFQHSIAVCARVCAMLGMIEIAFNGPSVLVSGTQNKTERYRIAIKCRSHCEWPRYQHAAHFIESAHRNGPGTAFVTISFDCTGQMERQIRQKEFVWPCCDCAFVFVCMRARSRK